MNYARPCLQAVTLLSLLYYVQLLLRLLFLLDHYLKASSLICRSHEQIYSLAYSFTIDEFLSEQHRQEQLRLCLRTFVEFSNFA